MNCTRHAKKRTAACILALSFVTSHLAVSEPPELNLGQLLGEGGEASFYAHPTDPSLGIRVLFDDATLDTVSLESRKFQFVESFGAPTSYGPVRLPDGRYGHLMEAIPGSRETIVPRVGMEYEEWREAVQLVNGLSRKGIVLREPQLIRDSVTGKLRPIDIDPIRTSPERATEFYTIWKECWRTRVQRMGPAEIARHQARARSTVAARELARNPLPVVSQVSCRPSGAAAIDPKALISIAELPIAMALPSIERNVAENYYRRELSQFSTVMSALSEQLTPDDIDWIKSELNQIHAMKQSSFGSLIEFISYGQGSLLEQQGGALGVLRGKLEQRFPTMGWQRSWSQWFFGEPMRYEPLP
jgi:hypothetical protein